jgi:hypothetical protein
MRLRWRFGAKCLRQLREGQDGSANLVLPSMLETASRFRASVFTPLRDRWPHPLQQITRGIQIVDQPAFTEHAWTFWNLRRTEERDALERSHWLRIDAECEWHQKDAILKQLMGTLRTAMIGFQLWCPRGWDGIIIGAQQTDAGLNVQTVQIPEPYPHSFWSRMLSTEKCNPAQLPDLVEGTLTAFQSKIVRQINPFQFLEIGLQTAVNHYRAGALLWIIGLDGLLAAEDRKVFKRRLMKLLGKDALVFPKDHDGRQPTYTVGGVAGEVFKWRGFVAHGKEILEDYRKPLKFEFDPPELAFLAVEKWTPEILCCESALFLLMAALRRIITDGLLPTLGNKRAWDDWIDA